VTAQFAGFPDFRSNVTFVPIQFFTVVIPNVRGGTIRLVAYMLRQVLGWVDARGNPTRAQLQFSYAELAEHAGLSRGVVVDAITEALEHHLLCRVGAWQSSTPRHASSSSPRIRALIRSSLTCGRRTCSAKGYPLSPIFARSL
jgi:hypothetical protein